MTYYAGLDVSMKSTSIAIVNETGKIIFETVCTTDPEIIAQILSGSRYVCEKIGVESGSISFWLIEELKKLSLPAICIDSRQMATIIEMKVNKTDRNDARLIANAMRCNLYTEVFHKSKKSIEIGLQMGVRRMLVDNRTKLKNGIRGFLKVYGIRLGTVAHHNFSEVVRETIQSVHEAVQESIECLLRSYEEICVNINKIDQSLEKYSSIDPVIALFESIPGVGMITALTYKAVIDDPHRFANARNVGAYLGLTPNQYSSGEKVRQGRISKCGCSELRTLLIECAVVMLTRTKGWTKLKAWGLRIMKRSGINKAAAAVARKLAIIMLRMWQEDKPFIWGEKKQDKNEKVISAIV